MKKNKISLFLAAAVLASSVLAGCGESAPAEAPKVSDSQQQANDVTVVMTDEGTTAPEIPTVSESGVGNAKTGEGSVAEKSSQLINAADYPLNCPFTEADWTLTPEALEELEGKSDDTYDSVYGGTTYTYPKEYKGKEGTIKYMFDDKNALMCVAWAYEAGTPEELTTIYDEIHTELVDTLGDSGYKAEHDTNYGDVWYFESGDVLISTMATSSAQALQYSYLNPIISKYQMIDAADAMESEDSASGDETEQ